jgi:O-antigen ligase
MFSNHHKSRFSHLALWVGVLGVGFGIVAGLLAGIQPLLLCVGLVAVVTVVYFFASFEKAVLGLLILRSSLDIFSAQQIPAAFAIGLDALALLYVTVMLLTGRTIRTDRFWWFFAGWVVLQSMWLVLMLLGGLGLDASYLPDSIREWMRLFSWLVVYFLLMQLQECFHPEKIVSILFFSLILPLIVASLQMLVPASLLPSILVHAGDEANSLPFEPASRINGTLGHYNTFAVFLVLFIGLTLWKLLQSQRRLPWALLLLVLTFFLASTKTIAGLAMLATLIIVMFAITIRPNPLYLIGSIVLVALLLGLVFGFFMSTEFGRERLSSIADTPLLNPNIDASRAVLMSWSDGNSFNWRVAQWTFLLQAWQNAPILGYGLGNTHYIGVMYSAAHNDYIRALVEGGIVGIASFLLFFQVQFFRLIRLIWCAPKGSSQRKFCAVLIAYLVAMLVGMITENIWSHTTMFFYWFALSAVAGGNWNKSELAQARTI